MTAPHGAVEAYLLREKMRRPLGGFAEVATPTPAKSSGTGAMVGMIVVGIACVGLVILFESGK